MRKERFLSDSDRKRRGIYFWHVYTEYNIYNIIGNVTIDIIDERVYVSS